MTTYLSPGEVMSMHAHLMKLNGGRAGIRDMAALEATLFRAQSPHYGDLITRAAALMESFYALRPFHDGNVVLSFAVVDVFLRLNGIQLKAPPEQIHAALTRMIETERFELKLIAQGLRQIAA